MSEELYFPHQLPSMSRIWDKIRFLKRQFVKVWITHHFFFFILINSNRKLDYIIEAGILSRIEQEWQSCERPPHKFLFPINLRNFCETDLISNAHLQNPIQIMWSLSLFPHFDPTPFVFSFNPITVFLYRPFAIFVVCFCIPHFESSISLSLSILFPSSICYL